MPQMQTEKSVKQIVLHRIEQPSDAQQLVEHLQPLLAQLVALNLAVHRAAQRFHVALVVQDEIDHLLADAGFKLHRVRLEQTLVAQVCDHVVQEIVPILRVIFFSFPSTVALSPGSSVPVTSTTTPPPPPTVLVLVPSPGCGPSASSRFSLDEANLDSAGLLLRCRMTGEADRSTDARRCTWPDPVLLEAHRRSDFVQQEAALVDHRRANLLVAAVQLLAHLHDCPLRLVHRAYDGNDRGRWFRARPTQLPIDDGERERPQRLVTYQHRHQQAFQLDHRMLRVSTRCVISTIGQLPIIGTPSPPTIGSWADASVGVLPAVEPLLRASPFSSSNGFDGCSTCSPPLSTCEFSRLRHCSSAGCRGDPTCSILARCPSRYASKHSEWKCVSVTSGRGFAVGGNELERRPVLRIADLKRNVLPGVRLQQLLRERIVRRVVLHVVHVPVDDDPAAAVAHVIVDVAAPDQHRFLLHRHRFRRAAAHNSRPAHIIRVLQFALLREPVEPVQRVQQRYQVPVPVEVGQQEWFVLLDDHQPDQQLVQQRVGDVVAQDLGHAVLALEDRFVRLGERVHARTDQLLDVGVEQGFRAAQVVRFGRVQVRKEQPLELVQQIQARGGRLGCGEAIVRFEVRSEHELTEPCLR
uniref:Uncharacterized protein n=1 Tax=Anopheles melas TaxID=34690 RepID=A0A182TUY6_9DIPT